MLVPLIGQRRSIQSKMLWVRDREIGLILIGYQDLMERMDRLELGKYFDHRVGRQWQGKQV